MAADLIVRIGDYPYIYHIEFQTVVDLNMPRRMFDYDKAIDQNIEFEDGNVVIKQALVQIEGESAKISYLSHNKIHRVKVVNLEKLSIDKLLDSGLYFLIPFYPCRYKDELTEDVVCDIIKDNITNAFMNALSSLVSLYDGENVPYKAITDLGKFMSIKLHHLVTKDKKFVRGVDTMLFNAKTEFDKKYATKTEIEFDKINDKLEETSDALEEANQTIDETNEALSKEKAKSKKLSSKNKELNSTVKDQAAEIEKLKTIIAAAGLTVEDNK